LLQRFRRTWLRGETATRSKGKSYFINQKYVITPTHTNIEHYRKIVKTILSFDGMVFR
jgi:hypothetical protein